MFPHVQDLRPCHPPSFPLGEIRKDADVDAHVHRGLGG